MKLYREVPPGWLRFVWRKLIIDIYPASAGFELGVFWRHLNVQVWRLRFHVIFKL